MKSRTPLTQILSQRERILVLLALLLEASFLHAQMPTLEDEHYKTACGPIAAVVSLETLGIETSLDEMAKRCGWEQNEMLLMEKLQNAIRSYHGIDCHAAQLSPEQLVALLKDDQTVVILALRKLTDEIDHAVCAIGVEDNDQVIHLIDYPELHRRKLIAELTDSWDGATLVVRVSPFYRALSNFALCFAPMVAVILSVLWFRHRKDKFAKAGDPPKALKPPQET